MVIGCSGAFETRIPAEECGRRLNSDRSAASYVGYADESGFEPLSVGSRVSYHIGLIPWIVWTLILSYVVEFHCSRSLSSVGCCQHRYWVGSSCSARLSY